MDSTRVIVFVMSCLSSAAAGATAFNERRRRRSDARDELEREIAGLSTRISDDEAQLRSLLAVRGESAEEPDARAAGTIRDLERTIPEMKRDAAFLVYRFTALQ
jgi:hypothetical protein